MSLKLDGIDQPSNASKIWQDFSKRYLAETNNDELKEFEGIDSPEEFKDQYVRLPYDAPNSGHNCHW
jgi:hypothetical protein